jgi:hypothetical protein
VSALLKVWVILAQELYAASFSSDNLNNHSNVSPSILEKSLKKNFKKFFLKKKKNTLKIRNGCVLLSKKLSLKLEHRWPVEKEQVKTRAVIKTTWCTYTLSN